MTFTVIMFCILLGTLQATTETFDTSSYQILSDAAATDFPANYDNFTTKCRGIFNKIIHYSLNNITPSARSKLTKMIAQFTSDLCCTKHSSFSIILSSKSMNSLNWVYSNVSLK